MRTRPPNQWGPDPKISPSWRVNNDSQKALSAEKRIYVTAVTGTRTTAGRGDSGALTKPARTGNRKHSTNDVMSRVSPGDGLMMSTKGSHVTIYYK